MIANRHSDRDYERELEDLRDGLIRMGGRVEKMLHDSFSALVERDAALAERVIKDDLDVDRDEIAIDQMCLRVLARRQPTASDLRFITLVLKAVTDLERVGDLARNICERAISLSQQPPLKPFTELPRLHETCALMLNDAMDAFISGDVDKAEAVLEADEEVDALFLRIFHNMLEYMHEDPAAVDRAIELQSVGKYLERVADHATNLAEHVVFMVAGRDIRHASKLEAAEGERDGD